jgi:hypothetical protein
MRFHKKLFIIDMILLIAVLSLMIIKPGIAFDFVTGLIAIAFVISFSNHIRHFILYKKFY